VQGNALIERLFKLQENQTTLRREMLGGLTTFIHDGVHHRGESANIVAGRDAGGGRGVRHVPGGGCGDTGDGALCELSDSAGAGDVAERVFHDGPKTSMQCVGHATWAHPDLGAPCT